VIIVTVLMQYAAPLLLHWDTVFAEEAPMATRPLPSARPNW